MHRSISHVTRLVLVASVIGLGTGHYVAQARTISRQVAQRAPKSEPVEALIWQGKILSIVTDVYSSFGDLSTALTNHDLSAVARVADDFAGERLRFESVKPTPHLLNQTSQIMDTGLRNLSSGTKSLVAGLRGNNHSASQQAENQILQGLKQFQQGVDQIHHFSGGGKKANGSAVPAASPTPIIRGLP